MPRTAAPQAKTGFVPSENYAGPELGRLVGTPADIFTKDKPKYASRFKVVKLNWTFHDAQRNNLVDYRKSALELHGMGLSAVVKVSRVATHDHRLAGGHEWWPELWAKYNEFLENGVLAAVLWQCPPSLRCTSDTLLSLEKLCTQLSQTQARHVFEFRHESWYGREDVYETLQRHGCCLAWLHITEPSAAAWAKCNGWSEKVQTAYFSYIQLHGTDGRAKGSYPAHALREVSVSLPSDAIVLFCQVDVPAHAWSNAEAFSALVRARSENPNSHCRQGVQTDGKVCEDAEAAERVHDGSSSSGASRAHVVGKVVSIRGLTAVVDVCGKKYAMGLNHMRSSPTGLPREGDVLRSLQIEEDDGGELRVSSVGNTRVATRETQSSERQATVSRRWGRGSVEQPNRIDDVALREGLLEAGFSACGEGLFVSVAHGVTVELESQCLWSYKTIRANVAGRGEEEVAAFIASLVGEDARLLGRKLLEWSQLARDATVAEVRQERMRAAFRGVQTSSDESDNSDEDADTTLEIGVSDGIHDTCRDLEYVLPSPNVVGANRERRIKFISWGTNRLPRPPEVEVHITCSIKKFHYLTRNNKHIKRLNGLNEEVQGQIMRCGFFSSWVADVVSQIESKDLACLGLHCFKGTHRSVAAAEILRKVYYPRALVEHLSLQFIRPGRAGGPSRH
eukprot:TRINITY_DN49129_c0_g1_i1.p1 TRINITY_DN49129_c0_g1~~TRINITY_DN49129_c0_g1_i1.p1  ORF type:complete len:678 (-),score=84.16 TRINITY_DN49129_c0_g1_i1:151-2184(-)